MSNKTADLTSENFDKFIKRAKKYDPMLLWGVLRPKIMHHVTLWDFLVDKTVCISQESAIASGEPNVPAARLKIMLNELNHLLNLVAQVLEHCCESHVKVEEGEDKVQNEVLKVPEKLMPAFGMVQNHKRLKSNVDLTKYERLFAIDDSLKSVSVSVYSFLNRA